MAIGNLSNINHYAIGLVSLAKVLPRSTPSPSWSVSRLRVVLIVLPFDAGYFLPRRMRSVPCAVKQRESANLWFHIKTGSPHPSWKIYCSSIHPLVPRLSHLAASVVDVAETHRCRWHSCIPATTHVSLLWARALQDYKRGFRKQKSRHHRSSE